MIPGTPPDLHGRSQGRRERRELRAGSSLGEVTIGVGTVDTRMPTASGVAITGSVDHEWDGLRLASVEAAWSQPVNGTTNMQDFPEVAAQPPSADAYLGPRSGSTPLDLSSADHIILRIWLYGDSSSSVLVQPTGHFFDLNIGPLGALLGLSVSDFDLTWEAKLAQPDWSVADWNFRGHMDVDGRVIHDYCLAHGESPAFQLSRDFGANINWSGWLSPADHLIDHIVLEWLTARTVPPVEGRIAGSPVILEGRSQGAR